MDYINWTLYVKETLQTVKIILWLTVAFFADTMIHPSLILKSAVAFISTDETEGGNSKYLTYKKRTTRA